MNLEVELFRTRGRAARAIDVEVVGPLTSSDLALLDEEKGSQPSAIKRLSERHHALARNLASGLSPGEAAIIAGYCSSRVSILQDDPAFRELVEFYRKDVDHAYRDLHQRLSGLALTAAEELADRLEDTPEKFSIGQLQEVVKLGADRTGHGPSQGTGPVVQNNFVVALPPKAEDTAAWHASHAPRTIEHKDD